MAARCCAAASAGRLCAARPPSARGPHKSTRCGRFRWFDGSVSVRDPRPAEWSACTDDSNDTCRIKNVNRRGPSYGPRDHSDGPDGRCQQDRIPRAGRGALEDRRPEGCRGGWESVMTGVAAETGPLYLRLPLPCFPSLSPSVPARVSRIGRFTACLTSRGFLKQTCGLARENLAESCGHAGGVAVTVVEPFEFRAAPR